MVSHGDQKNRDLEHGLASIKKKVKKILMGTVKGLLSYISKNIATTHAPISLFICKLLQVNVEKMNSI